MGVDALPDLIGESVAAVAAGGDPLPGATIALLEWLAVASGLSSERRVTDDQTNASVVADGRFIVKWLRVPDPVDRGWALVKHARANGFTATPAAPARLQSAGRTLATVHEYLPDAVDGWTWCVAAAVAEIRDGTTAGAWAPAIGSLTAQLAAALATAAEDTATVVGDVADDRGMDTSAAGVRARELIHQTHEEVRAASRLDSGGLLRDVWHGIDRAAADAIGDLVAGPAHGDLHVGQLLEWPGGFAIVDFDGDPARPSADLLPYDVDLAHLLVSLELVGSVAAKRLVGEAANPNGTTELDARIAAWAHSAKQRVLDAYRAELRAADLLALHRPELLEVLEVRQLARELEYADAYLPRFEYATVDALRRRLTRVKPGSASRPAS